MPRDPLAWQDAVSPLSLMPDEEFEKLDAQMSESIEQATYAAAAASWGRPPAMRTRTKKETRNAKSRN